MVPGKTALNKVVGKFFGDKINAVTLEGIGASPDDVSQNINNQNNLKNGEENPFTTFRTCLGDTLIDTSIVGDPIIGGGPGGLLDQVVLDLVVLDLVVLDPGMTSTQ